MDERKKPTEEEETVTIKRSTFEEMVEALREAKELLS